MIAPASLAESSELELWQDWAEHRSDSAAEELWRRTQGLAVAVASRSLRALTNPRERARELVDDAFVRALRSFAPERASPHTTRPFRAWFLRLVRSAAIDQLRRTAREPQLAELALHSQPDAAPAPDARIDAERIVAWLEHWNRTEGLEEDWPVLVAWLQCRHDGVRVPWKELAEAHPVRPPPELRFAPGAAVADPEDPALVLARHKLRLCPRLSMAADGASAAPESPELGGQRAGWVVRLLRESLVVKRVRRGGESRPRVVPGQAERGQRRVRFRLTSGAQRTADALRMRVEKVILGKVLRLVQGGAT